MALRPDAIKLLGAPLSDQPPWCLICYNMDADCPENEEWDNYFRLRRNLLVIRGLWLGSIPIDERLSRSALRCHVCQALHLVIFKLPLGYEAQQREQSINELLFLGPRRSVKNCSGQVFITLERGKGIAPKLLLGGLDEEVELYTP